MGEMNVLITGGLGFLGSNLAIKLAESGNDVTILDAMIPGLGGNDFNVSTVKNKVVVVKDDVRNEKTVAKLVKGRDVIFHLAGQVDHHRSMEHPEEDLDIRCRGTLTLLEAMRRYNTSAKLVFSSTRAVYGSPEKLPVDEKAQTNPKGMYAATSLTAEKMIAIYGNVYGIPHSILRITNGFGPRQQMVKPYGVANWFVRKVIDGNPITLMGDGKTLRDYLYVDDMSSAFIAAATSEKANSEVFNVASGKAVSFIELAKEVIKQSGSGNYEFVPYPEDTRKLEPGSFVADTSKITRMLKWKPQMKLGDGLKLTIQFYKANKQHYW